MRDFPDALRRLLGRARRDNLLRRLVAGLFCGLACGLVAAVAGGSISFPFPAWIVAVGCAALGAAAGLSWGAFERIDPRRLLIAADRRLGTHELASTALELSRAGATNGLSAAVVEDAAALLAETPPRALLGGRRLPLLPFAGILACLTVAALLFPVDIGRLFNRSRAPVDLVELGNELQALGERLRADAERGPGRNLALPQQLAQLGRDLSDKKVPPDEALDRISELESDLSQEYELRLEEAQPKNLPPDGTKGENGTGGSGQGKPGDATSKGDAAGNDASVGRSRGRDLNDLGGAIDTLKNAKRGLSEGGGGARGSKPPAVAQGPQGGGDTASPDAARTEPGDGGAGEGAAPDLRHGRPDQPGTGGPGTAPAPEKHGEATPVEKGTGPGLKADSTPGEGDNTRLLARALPEWSGSRLPEEQIMQSYARQAESALARDEVPLALRQAVRDYFTTIGIAGGNNGGAGTGGVGN